MPAQYPQEPKPAEELLRHTPGRQYCISYCSNCSDMIVIETSNVIYDHDVEDLKSEK